MPIEDKNHQTLWKHSSFEIFDEVRRKKLTVGLRCGISLNGENVDVALKGYFSKVDDNAVAYDIVAITPLTGKNSGDEKNCSFSFIHDRQSSEGVEKLSFTGRGTVIEVKRMKDGKPTQLLLHLAPHLLTSKARREERLNWKHEDTKVLWCMVVRHPPEEMQGFREIIAAHYKAVQGNINAKLKDISAGGACVWLADDSTVKKFFINDHYMLFFVPTHSPGLSPFVLLAKKVGRDRKGEHSDLFIHLRFCHELDWNRSGKRLAWTGIENIGSERLRLFIQGRK
ncbi:MAG: hypothetical protein LBC94_09915 [Desulfovibrio sp.]|jgi:hypothetical protein|nr:hypothetical protein [Desulfovibrio sp.]